MFNLPESDMSIHFSARFAREYFARVDLVTSKHSEKCCLTTEQILLDCFGLRMATLLKLSQNGIQEARFFVWTERKSKLATRAPSAPCFEALCSLCVRPPNPGLQTSGIWLCKSSYSKCMLPIAFTLWLASKPAPRMRCKTIISWNII